MKHINISIYGRVQGVGFRHAAKHQARYLGIHGYIRNMPDGSVFIEAEGEETALTQFVHWCRKGPEYAQIEKINTEESPIRFYTGFNAQY